MKLSKREKTKILIELSETTKEADKTIEEYLGDNPSLKEKMAFLHGMFDFEVVGHPEEADAATYYSILNAIINAKYGT